MTIPAPPAPTSSDPAHAPAWPTGDIAAPGRSVLQRARQALRRVLHAAADALERDERRITEGFRVPPHGG